MKGLKFNLATLLILLLSTGVYAQEGIEKTVSKQFDVSKDSEFRISNKFGDIRIEDWNESKISVVATIIADTQKKDKAEKLFSRVKIDMSQQGNMMSVRTIFEKNIDKKDIRVNYLIRMPKDIKVELENKFGDVYINELAGNVDLGVAYGNLKVNKLTYSHDKPMNHINLAYGSAEIDECNWLKLTVKYSSIEITKANALILDSRYSSGEYDESNSLVAVSKYDNYEIGSTRNIVVQSKFSNYEIGHIANKIDLQFEYGNFEVGHVQENFESIDITNKYGDIEIGIDEQASYHIDADVKYCDLDIPDNNRADHHVDGSQEYYKGLVGSDNATKSKVKVYSKYGGVDLD